MKSVLKKEKDLSSNFQKKTPKDYLKDYLELERNALSKDHPTFMSLSVFKNYITFEERRLMFEMVKDSLQNRLEWGAIQKKTVLLFIIMII